MSALELTGLLGSTPHLDGAACLGLWSLFDEPSTDDPDARYANESARKLCATCPALADCGRWFDSLPRNRRPSGVVAGRLRRVAPPRPRRKAVAA